MVFIIISCVAESCGQPRCTCVLEVGCWCIAGVIAGVATTEHVLCGQAAARGIDKQKTAGMLAIYSVFLLAEGVVRTLAVSATPAGSWGVEQMQFPPVVLLIGAVLEVAFAMTGLITAVALLALDYENTRLTIVTLCLEATGWFTFIVYTIAEPGEGRHGYLLSI